MSPRESAKQMIARINYGFDNEHHWMAFRKKYNAQIEALPLPLRNQVLMAWEQASTPEFSRKAR